MYHGFAMLLRASIPLLIALTAAVPLSAQTTSAFDKSMPITNDDAGKTLKVNGVLRVEVDKVVFWGKKEGPLFEAPCQGRRKDRPAWRRKTRPVVGGSRFPDSGGGSSPRNREGRDVPCRSLINCGFR